VGLVVVLALPYAFAGPRIILDDWFFLRNAHFDGAFSAGGARQLMGRPGAWLLYAFQFGIVGRRPLALYVLQTAANAAVAVALFRRRCLTAPILASLLALALVTEWLWSHRLYPDVHRADLGVLFPIHFGSGISSFPAAAVVLSIVGAIGVTLGVYRRDRLVLT